MEIRLAPRSSVEIPTQIEHIDVQLTFSGISARAGQPLFEMPLVSSNVDTVATVLARIDASDDRGALKLMAQDADGPTAAAGDAQIDGVMRRWTADRAISGPVVVRYSVPAGATLPPRGAAPPFAFSHDAGGSSGAGLVFLLLPPGDAAYRTTVKWDLSALPAGAQGVSSYGTGSVTAPAPLTATQLRMSYFMAGRVQAWPLPAPKTGFFSAWQGDPPFDAGALMHWTSKLYDRYSQFFGQKTPPPYAVFMRYNPVNAGGGVSLHQAFVTTFGKPGGAGSNVTDMKMTLAHEMFHTFSPYIQKPAGLESSWFSEGLATYYMRKLPFRFGMISTDEFLSDLNYYAGRYYTSALADEPNSEVPKRFWADTRIRTLPYDRGMLYFADLDDRLRKHSKGARSLDDLMKAMLKIGKMNPNVSNSDWEVLLNANLGPDAVRGFHAFLAGAPPLPASDAFGPCFYRTTAPLRRYDLGFDSAVLAEPQRIVRGLRPDSAAAKAGLRNGDEIVRPVPQDDIQGRQGKLLSLRIRRGTQEFDLSYLPRGETVSAYQWRRTPGADERRCAL